MGKEKKEKRKSESGEGEDKESYWAERLNHVTPIANPLASRKLAKKLYKCMKKAFNEKMLRKGVKEVQRFLRKGERGIIVLAGDINPIDVICHMPLVCEEKDIPYCYTPSKEDLGAALGSKRPSTMVLIKEHDEYKSLYNELYEEVSSLPMPIS